MLLTLSLTILPSILIASFVIFSDKFREPVLPIIYAVLLGFLIMVPAGLLNNYFIFSNENFYNLTFIAGFTEEPLKFIMMYIFLRKRHEFDEPMDALVYATLLSLGFATLENYEYVFIYSEKWEIDPYQLAIWRSYSAVPMHGLLGCVMGFYFGMYTFTANKKYLILCLLIPFIIHGLYNFLSYPYHFMILGVLTIYTVILHSNLKKLQESKKNEGEIKKI